MRWPDLVYRLAVHDRLCGAAFLESCVGSDYLAVLLGSRIEIVRVAVEERTGIGAVTIQKRPSNTRRQWTRLKENRMEHLVLLGDSIFDNKSYVGESPDVIGHLRELIPANWSATLCAVDGDTTSGIERQLTKVPKDATCLFVSVGGNDALINVHLLSDMTRSGPVLLDELSRIADAFHKNYYNAIDHVCRLRKPTCVCTIYDGNLEADVAPAAKAAVAVFNDKIYSVANERHLAVIELRRICNQPDDYANFIEPSALGGKKIAKAIYDHVQRRQILMKTKKK